MRERLAGPEWQVVRWLGWAVVYVGAFFGEAARDSLVLRVGLAIMGVSAIIALAEQVLALARRRRSSTSGGLSEQP